MSIDSKSFILIKKKKKSFIFRLAGDRNNFILIVLTQNTNQVAKKVLEFGFACCKQGCVSQSATLHMQAILIM